MVASQSLALYLFGSPRVELDGQPVDIHLHRALAVLIYMALNWQVHRRDSLSTFFWPDCSPRQSHGNLRNVLWVLKEALGGDRLLIHREEISLNPSLELWVDVTCFEMHLKAVDDHSLLHQSGTLCPACAASLQQAVALYQDDFLNGFTLQGSPTFDLWQGFETEGLRLALASALERLADWYESEKNFSAAVQDSRRLIQLDPCHEKARVLLMKAYYQSGQPGAALRQYQEYCLALEQELGGSPSAEMTDIYHQMKTGQYHPE